MRVEDCYLYPVKGMTPASVAALQLEPGKSPTGDRGFVFAYADAEMREPRGWVNKYDALTGLSTPGLAEVEADYDAVSRVLTLRFAGEQQAASVDDEAQRQSLARWLGTAVRTLPRHPFHKQPEHEPLQLLGDGESLFTDRGPSQVSIGSRASLASLAEAAGVEVDMRRFRSNIVIDVGEAWEEFGWAGKRLRIGETLLEVTAPLRRCKAINANPAGGGRDINLLEILDENFGHLNFGIEANVIEGGAVHPGDAITVVEG